MKLNKPSIVSIGSSSSAANDQAKSNITAPKDIDTGGMPDVAFTAVQAPKPGSVDSNSSTL